MKEVGPPRRPPCGPWPVQLVHQTGLTGEAYVSKQAWKQASLLVCPLHEEGGCGFTRHGTYGRVKPAGMRVARWYCHAGKTTISLLPDFMAARLPGTLAKVEETVVTVEKSPGQEQAAEAMRGDIELQGALRWMRRRLVPIRAALQALIGLMPELFACCNATIGDFRRALNNPSDPVLVCLREVAVIHLPMLPAPLGLGPRMSTPLRRGHQHGSGTDPPRVSC